MIFVRFHYAKKIFKSKTDFCFFVLLFFYTFVSRPKKIWGFFIKLQAKSKW